MDSELPYKGPLEVYGEGERRCRWPGVLAWAL